MKRVLITGAGGFIGSHLAELCVRRGLDVRAFVHYNSRNTWGWLDQSELRDQMEVVAGDIRDFDRIHEALAGVDTVFHLAALIGIPYSYVSPKAYIETNVTGTYNVVQAARMHGTARVVVTSTSETYGTAQYVPIDERHPAVGQSPYAATKVAADQLALSYYRSFELPVHVVRPFNTFGPRQSARAVIPTIIGQLLAGTESIRLGNVTPTRDLTFVEDTAAAFLAVAQSDALRGQAVNVGNGTEISIGDLALLIGRLMGRPVAIETDEERLRPDASEVERLLCDNSLVREHTDWRPAHTLEEGLEKTISFLEQHLHLYKTDLYNV